MIGLKRRIEAKQFARQPLKQDASNQPIQITFVRDDQFGSGQGATHIDERNELSDA
jgi:hypothetical protein